MLLQMDATGAPRLEQEGRLQPGHSAAAATGILVAGITFAEAVTDGPGPAAQPSPTPTATVPAPTATPSEPTAPTPAPSASPTAAPSPAARL